MYKNLSLVYDKLMDVDYEKYIDLINQELEDKNNLLILDLGCGSGNLIKHLAKYGSVVGVDKSEEMLSLASSKYPEHQYFALDLLDVQCLNMQFDVVVSAFDVLNYLDNISQLEEAFRNIFTSMKDNGKFIFDMHTPQKIEYMLKQEVFAYDDEEISYLWYTYNTENDLEIESELTFFIREKSGLYRKVYEFQKQRTYPIEDILLLLDNIGFKDINYICDFDKNMKNYKTADRVIFSCTR